MDEATVIKQIETSCSCKICSGILIQVKAIDCGHIFCTYCLDLLQTFSNQCPECSKEIKMTISIPRIDERISKLIIKSGSKKLQEDYQNAMSNRSEQNSKRQDTIQQLQKSIQNRKNSDMGSARDPSKIATVSAPNPINDNSFQNVEKLCKSLASAIATPGPMKYPPKPQKASFLPPCGSLSTPRLQTQGNDRKPSDFLKSRRSVNNLAIKSPHQVQRAPQKPRSKIGIRNTDALKAFARDPNIPFKKDGTTELLEQEDNRRKLDIDPTKVDNLFHLYDNFLHNEVSNGVNGAGGDICEQGNRNSPLNLDGEDSEEIVTLKNKNKLEIETLVREAEDAVELDGFVKKWSEEFQQTFEPDNKEDEDFVRQLKLQLQEVMKK